MKRSLSSGKIRSEVDETIQVPLYKDLKCGHFGIKILRDGSWLYHDSPIKRMEIVKLFSTVLKLDDNGIYYLETPVEKGVIDVEDAPFTATSMIIDKKNGTQSLNFITNLGDKVIVNDQNPIYMDLNKEKKEYCPYVIVRKNLKALIVRSVYYDLVNLAVNDPKDTKLYGIWSNNIFFKLGRVD
tara:strand:+ start:1806 stop:2357 length:552 start_codon:yes stop_codon:yes gene_type:complete